MLAVFLLCIEGFIWSFVIFVYYVFFVFKFIRCWVWFAVDFYTLHALMYFVFLFAVIVSLSFCSGRVFSIEHYCKAHDLLSHLFCHSPLVISQHWREYIKHWIITIKGNVPERAAWSFLLLHVMRVFCVCQQTAVRFDSVWCVCMWLVMTVCGQYSNRKRLSYATTVMIKYHPLSDHFQCRSHRP